MTSIEAYSIGSVLGNLVKMEVQLCHYLLFQVRWDQGVKKLRKLIYKLDSKHSGFFRLAFAKDLDDPSLYDLVVSCEKLGYESAARLIIAAAQAEEIHACSLTALEAMERLSCVKKVQAALLKDNLDDSLLTVDVSEMGVVELSGLTHSQGLLDQIIEVVQKVPGVSEVNCEIVIGPSLYAGDLDRPR